jgi:hypothetical protein
MTAVQGTSSERRGARTEPSEAGTLRDGLALVTAYVVICIFSLKSASFGEFGKRARGRSKAMHVLAGKENADTGRTYLITGQDRRGWLDCNYVISLLFVGPASAPRWLHCLTLNAQRSTLIPLITMAHSFPFVRVAKDGCGRRKALPRPVNPSQEGLVNWNAHTPPASRLSS